jgi:hypothetical protein
MTQEVLKLALDALEMYGNRHRATYLLDGAWDEEITLGDKAITAIKEALAQEKALQALHSENERLGLYKEAYAQSEQEPVAWVKEDVCEGQRINGRPRKIWWECEKGVGTAFYTHPPQRTEQEPVAWADIQKEAQQIVESKFLWKQFIDGTPLSNDIACWMADFAQQYTTPPQRTWVGIPEQDLKQGDESFFVAWREGACWAEAKLKEKNT